MTLSSSMRRFTARSLRARALGTAIAIVTMLPATAALADDQSSDPCGGPGRLLATLNRPTIGFSTCAVDKGHVVLENGYQLTVAPSATPQTLAQYTQGFQRFGLGKGLELDAIGPLFNRARTGASVTTGFGDYGVGAKYEFRQRGRFTYALDGLWTLPSGSNGFSTGAPAQTFNLDIAYQVSSSVGVGTTLAAVSSAGPATTGVTRRFGAFDPSVVVTDQLPHYYQFYAEFVANTATAPGSGGRVFTDFGLQKLIGSGVELDLEYGIGFAPTGGPNRFHYLGFGTGIRL